MIVPTVPISLVAAVAVTVPISLVAVVTARINLVAVVAARISLARAVSVRTNRAAAVAASGPTSSDPSSTDRRMRAPCPSGSIRVASTH